MSKSLPLNSSNMKSFFLHPGIFNLLSDFHEIDRKPHGTFRILDWGCGRGRSVAWLLERGYSAFGIDVDPGPISNASEYFRERGWNPENTLRLLSDDGCSTFEDSFFQVTFSDQVLEHVRDLESVASELFRVSASGAVGLHIFPSYRTVIEPHLFMPFIHWLPKNTLMKGCMRLFLAFGMGPKWPELEGLENQIKAERLFAYCSDKTFYRKPDELRTIFQNAGFNVSFILTRRKTGLLAKLARIRFLAKATIWIRSRFFMTELFLQKPHDSNV